MPAERLIKILEKEFSKESMKIEFDKRSVSGCNVKKCIVKQTLRTMMN